MPARHAWGVFDPMVVRMLVFFDFKGPPPGTKLPVLVRNPFLNTFLHYFSEPFLSNDWCPKALEMGAQNGPKSQKSHKNPPSKRSIVRTCKKTPLGRGQTSKIDDSYTLSAVFSKAHFSQKVIKMGAKMESKVPKIPKNL